MLGWAARLDPATGTQHLLEIVEDPEAHELMQDAAVDALGMEMPPTEARDQARRLVVDALFDSLRNDPKLLGTLPMVVMRHLRYFPEQTIPHLKALLQFIRSSGTGTALHPWMHDAVAALDAVVAAGGEAGDTALRVFVAEANMGLADLALYPHLGAAGITGLAELAERPPLSLEDRYRVIEALVKMGEAAHPELADLRDSAQADARFMAVMMAVWTESVSEADLEALLPEATEVQWRWMAKRLFEKDAFGGVNNIHVLRDGAHAQNLGKHLALARIMARQLADPQAAAFRKELAQQYFKALHVGPYSSNARASLIIHVAMLREDSLRTEAVAYLKQNDWEAVEPLHQAWQAAPDGPYREAVAQILMDLGNQLADKILRGDVDKSAVQNRRAAMEVLAPLIRARLVAEAAQHPRAVMAWAEQMGFEGADLVEALARHPDKKMQQAALRASERMGVAVMGGQWDGMFKSALDHPEVAMQRLQRGK
jgi:hypothetical protein